MTGKLKYKIIYDHFLNLIKSHQLKPGDRLLTEAEIESKFNVSRITVVKALNCLEKDKHIHRIQGSGSFVSDDTQTSDDVKLVALIIAFRGLGREVKLIESIEEEFSRSGFSLLVKNSSYNPETETQILNSLQKSVSGVLLYPVSPMDNLDTHRELFKAHFPIVYLDRYPSDLPVSFVASDNFSGGYQIGKYMIENDHECFILAFHDTAMLTSERDRINGFMKAMTESSIPKKNISIFEYNKIHVDEEETFAQLDKHVHKGSKTAIFTCNDTEAYRIMNVIKNRMAPGNELFTVAGFDDLDLEPVTLPFVTISQDYTEIGRQASQLLLKKIENNNFFDEQISIPVNLIIKKNAYSIS